MYEQELEKYTNKLLTSSISNEMLKLRRTIATCIKLEDDGWDRYIGRLQSKLNYLTKLKHQSEITFKNLSKITGSGGV